MDWLEEKAEKIRRYIQNSSIGISLLCYICLAIMAAGVLTLLTRYFSQVWIAVITRQNPGINVYQDSWGNTFVQNIGSQDKAILYVALFFKRFGLLIFSLGAIGGTAFLFVRNKLNPAIKAAKKAIEYLRIGDYGHELAYRSEDELGRLCQEAEGLRLHLIEEKRRQWEGKAEQRDINAAFAHDMRTPLTVMQGYTEFLLKYIPQGKVTEAVLIEKLEILKHQQERLLQFSMTMTEIRGMEMREIKSHWYEMGELKHRLKMVTEGLAHQSGKRVEMLNEKDNSNELNNSLELSIDIEIFLEVFENLLNNAGRYAREKIEIKTELIDKMFTVYVKDDGPGFSPRALREANTVYYSEDKGEGGHHFGMGLFIAQLLCEKHGGSLTLVNSVDGGAIAAASFLTFQK